MRGRFGVLLAGLVAAPLALTSFCACAQGVPGGVGIPTNPGLVNTQNRQNEQQIRQQNEQILNGPAVVSPAIAATTIGPKGGPTFRLKHINFDNSVFISRTELAAIAAPYIGRTVDISDIQRIVKAVNDIYAARGLTTAAAYLPPQNLKDGDLRIGIVEGRLGKLGIKGETQLRPDYIRAHVTTISGQVVDVPLLTREIASFNKTGVAQIQASLRPGASFGLSDIDLAVIEPPAVSVNLFGDNQGVEAVNKYEGGFLIQGYSPLGIDDRLTLYGVGSQGNLDGNIAYSIPFNPWNGRIGVSYTRGRIYVVDGPFADLDIKGQSQIASLNMTQPLYVDPNWFFLLNSAFSYYLSSSTQTDIPVTDDTTYKETAGFAAGYTNGTFSLSVSPTYSAAQTSYALTGTDQHFSLYNGVINSTLRLPDDFVALFTGNYQISSAALISGDQLFQDGGPTTVRGYTTQIVAGASGYFTNLELHHNANFILKGLDLYAFYDRGSVYSTSPAVVTLNSVGGGLSYDFNDRLVAEISAGVPLDHIVSNQPPFEVYFRVTTKFNSNDFGHVRWPWLTETTLH